jgi:hypothetical protein
MAGRQQPGPLLKVGARLHLADPSCHREALCLLLVALSAFSCQACHDFILKGFGLSLILLVRLGPDDRCQGLAFVGREGSFGPPQDPPLAVQKQHMLESNEDQVSLSLEILRHGHFCALQV